MQLVMKRARLSGARWYSFSITARLTIDREEKELLTRYRLHNTILTEGDPVRDMKKAAWYTAPPGLLFSLILGGYFFSVTAFIIGLILAACTWYGVYQQIREEVRVDDLLFGREFKTRSFIGLLTKEHKIRHMAAIFANVLTQARTWHEPEIIDLAPQPLFTVVESERAAA